MNLEELIFLQNPWFRDPNLLPVEDNLPKRDLFQSLLDDVLNLKQIIALTGLRRVGKSTLLKQIIAHLLKNKIEPKRILYFSFDQPAVAESKEALEAIIGYFLKKILKEEIYQLSKQVFIFFDEIQLIGFWQDILKRYYDLNQKIKFVVSGSASLFINQASKESLAGRIFERYLPPLYFSEYQRFSQKDDFIDYLNFGQFPELLEIADNFRKIEYLKDGVIGKVLEVDIGKIYGVRKTFDFERLFWSLLPNTGQIIASAKLMAELGLKKATFFKYLQILEQSLLINKVVNLSGSFRSEKRLLRKLYPASTNFLSLLPTSTNEGFKAECYVAFLLRKFEKKLYLYRLRDKEIDFILPEKKLAIEVKYQKVIGVKDYRFLEKFITIKNYQGVILAKVEEKKVLNKNLIIWPIEKTEELIKDL
jgi:predicted AAA+ superfamily ATPase